MRTMCTKCKRLVDVDDEFQGYSVECPYCHQEFYVRSESTNRNLAHRKELLDRVNKNSSVQTEKYGLCFWLGFTLSFFGLLIAAIIEKREGVEQAIRGIVLEAILGGIAGLLVMVLSTL